MAREPYQTLSAHATRYERLWTMFQAWHSITVELPTVGDPPPLSEMTVGEIGANGQEPGTFAVTFAGTTMYVRFGYLPGRHGTDGILQTYVLDPLTKDPVALKPILFKGNGATELRTSDGDEVMLDRRPDAFDVLALLMKAAIERT